METTDAIIDNQGTDAVMTWSGFSFLIVGVLLNAGAQLLLKAGTNSLGVITLTRANWAGEFGRMATEPHFIAGVACYGVSHLVCRLLLEKKKHTNELHS